MTPKKTTAFLPVIALGLTALLLPAAAQAERLQGDNFITVMQNNTLSGDSQDGIHYHVYFLPGGVVTYQDAAGKSDHGTWMIDKSGDVCVTWASLMAGKQNCYEVSFDKSEVTWGNKDTTMHGDLLGGVKPLKMKKKN